MINVMMEAMKARKLKLNIVIPDLFKTLIIPPTLHHNTRNVEKTIPKYIMQLFIYEMMKRTKTYLIITQVCWTTTAG